MNSKKKLNLLPEEIKNKYISRNLGFVTGGFAVLLVLILSIQYIQIGILGWQTDRIIASNQKYDEEKANIAKIEENIKKYNDFLKNYEDDCFPFSVFMYDLEASRPSDVFIISVDSKERLINEGVKAEEEKDKGKKEEKVEKKEDDKKDKDTDKDKEVKKKDEEKLEPQIAYVEDLSGREIVIRGFGSTQESISKFIYDITHLSYISNAKITATEEHKIENAMYNIFEITVIGGAY